jgi:hypothetical protein
VLDIKRVINLEKYSVLRYSVTPKGGDAKFNLLKRDQKCFMQYFENGNDKVKKYLFSP